MFVIQARASVVVRSLPACAPVYEVSEPTGTHAHQRLFGSEVKKTDYILFTICIGNEWTYKAVHNRAVGI